MNWWNMMETTFGTIMGATLGLGLWLNRKHIGSMFTNEDDKPMTFPLEFALLALHCTLLFYVEFRAVRQIDVLYDLGLIMAIIPIVAVVSGRLWPYAMIFPVTLMPIAGKTIRELVYRKNDVSPDLSFFEVIFEYPLWFPYAIIPMLIAIIAALFYANRHRIHTLDPHFAGIALLITGWTFFLLNWAFFEYPWPWAENWTGRTPNGIIFTICILGLTTLVVNRLVPRSAPQSDEA